MPVDLLTPRFGINKRHRKDTYDLGEEEQLVDVGCCKEEMQIFFREIKAINRLLLASAAHILKLEGYRED